ncbi:unnamed protein product [Taenia asiatica]|uniref:Tudor domain-containing protein n=1 Tax=Taenia asiatica TaxID=60517 RepID=A0A0R3VXY4_TAEAS|nr:unnamed protein product [Taenia asiatica]
MLAAGDKCCGTKSGDASPSFGFVENDVDEDLVVIAPCDRNAVCCGPKDGVMELKSANYDSPSRCSNSLCECYTKVQAGTDDVLNDCGNNSSTGSSLGNEDDLCDKMKKLSTSDWLEKQCKPREEISDSVFPKWHVGDTCVCRWCMDNKWYFAEITNIDHSSSFCEVRFTYFGAKQDIYIGDLHPVDASSWKRVVDEDNILAAQAMLIIAQIRSNVERLPMLEPFLGTKAGKSDAKNGKLRGKSGILRGKWKTNSGSAGSQTLRVLPLFWRSLLLESCGNDKRAVWGMINSWYMCGYQSGYATALKNGEGKRA